LFQNRTRRATPFWTSSANGFRKAPDPSCGRRRAALLASRARRARGPKERRRRGPNIEASSHIRAVWIVIAALTALRVAGLAVSPVELHGDEAQYWSWSHELHWGYFSKPPLVAWIAAATTTLFGDSEWAVRIATPFSHAAAALFLMAVAERRWGAQAAVWTGLLYITMPAIWLSSAIMSTDAFLLMLWAGGLWAFDRYLDRPSWGRALALGVFIGLGFLAKYAMTYFVIGLALLAVFHRPSRAALVRPQALAAAAVTLAFLTPNLVWNATHDFATIAHTAANANWGAENFRLDELATFLLDQFGVFGPIPFVILIWAFVAIARAKGEERARWLPLLAFAAPALAIVAVQAFLTRANANWAVASYTAGAIVVAAWALERGQARWLMAAVATQVAFGAVFATAAVAPAFADSIGLANAFKRARGWEETTAAVRSAYDQGRGGVPYAAVLVDNRLLFHDLEYYGRDDPLPLKMWLRFGGPTSHAEANAPMTALEGPVLVVSERVGDRPKITADFERSGAGEEIVIPLGGGGGLCGRLGLCEPRERRLVLFPAEGFEPLPRGSDYEARWAED
jgi:4-amino-4-deoxy-L-arabinose transferase-like glycosyltransferase